MMFSASTLVSSKVMLRGEYGSKCKEVSSECHKMVLDGMEKDKPESYSTRIYLYAIEMRREFCRCVHNVHHSSGASEHTVCGRPDHMVSDLSKRRNLGRELR
jgi:hypothetical protein